MRYLVGLKCTLFSEEKTTSILAATKRMSTAFFLNDLLD